jgi:3-phytase
MRSSAARAVIFAVIAFLVLATVLEAAKPGKPQPVPSVTASFETDPVPHSGDAADDIAIWVHPSDTSLSLVIGTDKAGGIAVYDLEGKQLQYLADGNINNVDLRYGFVLGGEPFALVVASNFSTRGVSIYKVEAAARQLVNVHNSPDLGIAVYGLCTYKSPKNGVYYFFVTEQETGVIQQWRIADDGAAGIAITLARSFDVGTQAEGCVADDAYGVVYFAEEDVAVWRYGAEPGDGTTSADRTLVDSTSNGRLSADIEGLTIYTGCSGRGYLMASSQGSSTFVSYDRETLSYVGTFKIGASSTIDAVTGTDGIDVTHVGLGSSFPKGVFVAQDEKNNLGTRGNTVANQNFKLVPWQSIANAFSPALAIDNVC